jgi:hypothetical protein
MTFGIPPMHCPYCHAPAFETLPQCGACGFSLERVDQYFGVMPRLQPGISDAEGLFKPKDFRRIEAASERLHECFPQVSFSVVSVSLRPDQPLSAYAFWIFNRGGVCRELHRGGKSRDILLTLGAAHGSATLMIGYGLEPFVSLTQLQQMVNAGAADFAAGRWADGVVAVIDHTLAGLTEIFSTLGRTYGLDMDAVRQEEDPAVARTVPAGVY